MWVDADMWDALNLNPFTSPKPLSARGDADTRDAHATEPNPGIHLHPKQRGVTLIYATHIFDGLENWATHVVFLTNGKVRQSRSFEESSLYCHDSMTEFGQYAGALTFENFGQVEIQSSLWELAELQALREKKVLG